MERTGKTCCHRRLNNIIPFPLFENFSPTSGGGGTSGIQWFFLIKQHKVIHRCPVSSPRGSPMAVGCGARLPAAATRPVVCVAMLMVLFALVGKRRRGFPSPFTPRDREGLSTYKIHPWVRPNMGHWLCYRVAILQTNDVK